MWTFLSILIIVTSSPTYQQCYLRKEIGSSQAFLTNIYTFNYLNFFKSLVNRIESEIDNEILPLNSRFARFQNGKSCMITSSELTAETLEIALANGFNSSLLTNFLMFPKLEFCLDYRNTKLLNKQTCQQYLAVISEELSLDNKISYSSENFLTLLVTGDEMKGVEILKLTEPVICEFTQKAEKLDMERSLVKTKIGQIMTTSLSIFEMLGLSIFSELKNHMTSCLKKDWNPKNIKINSEMANCLRLSTQKREKKSTWLSNWLGDGAELDRLSDQVSQNTEIMNKDLTVLQRNEALLNANSEILASKITELATNTKNFQKFTVASFMDQKISLLETIGLNELSKNNFLSLTILDDVLSELTFLQSLIGSLIVRESNRKCLIIKGKYTCINLQDSLVSETFPGQISLNLKLTKISSQPLAFLSCVPKSPTSTSILHHQHGIMKNGTLFLEGNLMMPINQLENSSFIYSDTKPLKELLQDNILLLLTNKLTGLYCLQPMQVFHSSLNVINCSNTVQWVRISNEDKLFTQKGLVLQSDMENLKLNSKQKFQRFLGKISDFENHIFSSFQPTKNQAWHKVMLGHFQNLNSVEALSVTIGSMSFILLCCLSPLILYICKTKYCCCFKQPHAEINIIQPSTVENIESRSRRLVREFIEKRNGPSNQA